MDMKRITEIDNKMPRAVEAVYYFGMYRVSFYIDDSYFVTVGREKESVIELSCYATKSNLGKPIFGALLTKYLDICENMNVIAVSFIIHEFSSALKACIGKYEQDTAVATVTTLHDKIERALNRIKEYGDGGYASFEYNYHHLYFHTDKRGIMLIDAATEYRLIICSDYKSVLENDGYKTIFIQLCENQITEYVKKDNCTREVNMFDGD